jgi:hypothetical protein
MTPSEIEPATFRLVAQCLNQQGEKANRIQFLIYVFHTFSKRRSEQILMQLEQNYELKILSTVFIKDVHKIKIL